MGHSLEFYMEGGRSRSGRTLPAKAGLLSVLLFALQKKIVDDIIIVPGAATYDKLFDGSYLYSIDHFLVDHLNILHFAPFMCLFDRKLRRRTTRITQNEGNIQRRH